MTNGVIYCNRCGAQNSALAKFCSNCGTPFAADPATSPSTSADVVPKPQGPAQPSIAQAQYSAPFSPPMYIAPSGAARYGGFWIRFVAFVIDAIAVGLVTGPVSAVIAIAAAMAGSAVAMPDVGVHVVRIVITMAFSSLANWLYAALLESSSYQATLGKMALGLKVTDLEEHRISFGRATARHFAKILSGLLLMIGFIMAGFTERKQALHDMLAGTLVIRTM